MANILSMTGFGRASSSGLIGKAVVEMKSVNNRSLKSSYRFPNGWGSLEPDLRPLVETGIERGSLEVYIQILPSAAAAPLVPPGELIDRRRLTAYVQDAKAAAVELGLAEAESITPFLSLPGVVREFDAEPDLDAWRPIILDAGEKSRKNLNDQRRKEGATLEKFFRAALKKMDADLKKVHDRAPQRIQASLLHYRQRVQTLLDQSSEKLVINPDAIARETVLMAEKMAIDEEESRLAHHMQTFAKELSKGGAVGKSLDFIAQEMLREANTMGAKSLDAGLTDLVLQLKTEIEKIKEQVANVE